MLAGAELVGAHATCMHYQVLHLVLQLAHQMFKVAFTLSDEQWRTTLFKYGKHISDDTRVARLAVYKRDKSPVLPPPNSQSEDKKE